MQRQTSRFVCASWSRNPHCKADHPRPRCRAWNPINHLRRVMPTKSWEVRKRPRAENGSCLNFCSTTSQNWKWNHRSENISEKQLIGIQVRILLSLTLLSINFSRLCMWTQCEQTCSFPLVQFCSLPWSVPAGVRCWGFLHLWRCRMPSGDPCPILWSWQKGSFDPPLFVAITTPLWVKPKKTEKDMA